MTLFDKDTVVGGQFNMAKLVPGKEEFYETLRYFKRQIEITNVRIRFTVIIIIIFTATATATVTLFFLLMLHWLTTVDVTALSPITIAINKYR